MADPIFSTWLDAATVFDEKAAEQVRNYAALSQIECWRWTPLKALRSVPRRFEVASYQFDFDEDVLMADDAPLDVLSHKDAPFAAVNLALSDDALSLIIPAGVAIAEPLAINLDAVGKKSQFSRVVVRVEKGAKAALWLDMAAERDAAQLPLLSIDVADGAEFDVVLWLSSRDDSQTAQIVYVASEQGADSRLRVNAVQSSGALARVDMHAEVKGQGSEFLFGGVQTVKGEQVADFHVNVRHLTEESQSRQIVRGVLNDKALGIFDGLIYVAHGSQQTDAQQDSRYILLSKDAKSHSVPRLEIYADDVQCAHGSTVGYLDPDSLFYLQSRGIDRETAQTMLITSFLHEAVVVAHEGIAQSLQAAIKASWEGEEDDDDFTE